MCKNDKKDVYLPYGLPISLDLPAILYLHKDIMPRLNCIATSKFQQLQ